MLARVLDPPRFQTRGDYERQVGSHLIEVLVQPVEHVTVRNAHTLERDGVLLRVEIVQVAQHETACVPEPAVGVARLL